MPMTEVVLAQSFGELEPEGFNPIMFNSIFHLQCVWCVWCGCIWFVCVCVSESLCLRPQPASLFHVIHPCLLIQTTLSPSRPSKLPPYTFNSILTVFPLSFFKTSFPPFHLLSPPTLVPRPNTLITTISSSHTTISSPTLTPPDPPPYLQYSS